MKDTPDCQSQITDARLTIKTSGIDCDTIKLNVHYFESLSSE